MQVDVLRRPSEQARKPIRRMAPVGYQRAIRGRRPRTIPRRDEAARTDILWIALGVLVIFVVSMTT